MHLLHVGKCIALAGALVGCASVPTLRGSPEDVANAIGANAVAYNQAYGRAIADQVLLNVLRARDRMPLYHLSMSGIEDNSALAEQFGQVTIGGVSLGDGDGGVGEWVGNRTLTTSPHYTLNPFSSNDDSRRARQLEPVPLEVFQHYWDNNWSVEILLMVMAERLELNGARIDNGSGGYVGNCGDRPDERSRTEERDRIAALPEGEPRQRAERTAQDRNRRCGFVWIAQDLANGPRPRLVAQECPKPSEEEPAQHSARVAAAPAAASESEEEEASDDPPRICRLDIVSGTQTYQVSMRSVDDMLYFVGSILRSYQGEAANSLTARVNVRPTNAYPADGEEWSSIRRTAPLFRVVAVDRAQHGAYAAEIVYRGQRYAAGPATGIACVGAANCANLPAANNDATSRVLSLLTQIVILSQSDEAQLAPRTINTN